MNELVYIILVNYKTVEDTIECVRSLENLKYKNYKVIIVENASDDGSYEVLVEKCKEHIVIKSDENLGFAGGNNLGVKVAIDNNADYVLLLNNDTVVEEDFLEHQIRLFKSSESIGLVGSKIKYYDNKNILNYDGGSINWKKFKTELFNYNCEDIAEVNDPSEVSFISGCCMMISRRVINEIGLLDESYFMYYEDTDYCARVANEGFKLMYEPKAVIYHKVSKSSGGDLSPFVLYWSTKNRIKFKNKFRYKVSAIESMYFTFHNYVTRIIRVVIYYLKGDVEKAKAILKGLGLI